MPKIVIVIPCYNEASRLPVSEITAFLPDHRDVHICLVDGGSTDQTGRLIEQAVNQNPDQVSSLSLAQNRGKAEAVRQGILTCFGSNDFEWLGYWDADMATPLDEIDHLLQFADEPVKLLMCSRIKRMGAAVDRHRWRHCLGRVMAALISWVLKLPVYDTQCGAKLIRCEEAEAVFAEKFVSKWLFDVEIIARMLANSPRSVVMQSIVEVPVFRWKDVPGSKLKVRHMIASLADLVRIHYLYRIRSGNSHLKSAGKDHS